MVQLELTPEERDELVRVLEEYLSNLRMEIADTDSSDFKEALRGEKHVVNDLLAKIKTAA